MAVLNFPDNPTIGQVYTFGTQSWTWSGAVWAVTVPSALESRVTTAEGAIVVNTAAIAAINANLSANYYTKTASDARYVPEINGLTALTEVNAADGVVVYDVSAASHKKITVANFFKPYGPQRRNMVDNATGGIAQRRYQFDNISTSPGNIHSADRFKIEAVSAATAAQFQSAVTDVLTPDGLDRALRITTQVTKTSLAADDHLVVFQHIEGWRLRATQMIDATTVLKPSVCSFWVYTTLAGTYVTEFRLVNASIVPNAYISRAVVLPANTWTKVTFTLPTFTAATAFNTTNDIGATIFFWLSAGSNWNSGSVANLSANWTASPTQANRVAGQTNLLGTASASWHVTNIQWELGSEATPFERLSYQDDLNECMRHYQMMTAATTGPQTGEVNGAYRFYGNGVMSTSAVGVIMLQHIRPMRRAVYAIDVSAANTFELWEGSRHAAGTALNGQIDGGSIYATRLDVTTAGGLVEGNACILRSNGVSTSYLGLSADL